VTTRTPGQPGVPLCPCQWGGGAVREGEVLFSVFFVHEHNDVSVDVVTDGPQDE
jgi:hypothetical protein